MTARYLAFLGIVLLAPSATASAQAAPAAGVALSGRVVDAFAVVNLYPEPVPYSAPRETLTSWNAKATLSTALPRAWQLQLAGVYLAPDLFPQGRIGSRASLDVGVKKSVRRGEFVINATDLLNTNQARRTIRGTDFSIVSRDYLETQVVRVGYTLTF